MEDNGRWAMHKLLLAMALGLATAGVTLLYLRLTAGSDGGRTGTADRPGEPHPKPRG